MRLQTEMVLTNGYQRRDLVALENTVNLWPSQLAIRARGTLIWLHLWYTHWKFLQKPQERLILPKCNRKGCDFACEEIHQGHELSNCTVVWKWTFFFLLDQLRSSTPAWMWELVLSLFVFCLWASPVKISCISGLHVFRFVQKKVKRF